MGDDRVQLDFSTDPPPDIAVEIDLHRDSLSKSSIYAALGVPEIWRYDGQVMTIYYLEQDHYVTVETSRALPLLSATILSQFLSRLRDEGELPAVLAFDGWLRTQKRL